MAMPMRAMMRRWGRVEGGRSIVDRGGGWLVGWLILSEWYSIVGNKDERRRGNGRGEDM